MQSFTLLIIGYVWPEPKSSAAGAHMMQIIEFFQSLDYQIIFASPAQPGENRASLTSLGILERNIALNCSSFDRWVQEINPDIVLFDRFMMEEQFGWRVSQYCPQAIRILETSDLHCLREARKQLLKKSPNTVVEVSESELYTTMVSLEITQREIASVYRCDVSLFVSDFEINLLHTLFKIPLDLLWHCPFMIDAPNSNNLLAFENRKNFITIGNFLHAPNWDSVLWLKHSIWPLILHQLPNAEIYIYGAYTPQKALEMHNPKQGFHMMGWAENALDVLQQARICLAPLRFGAGIKGKLADAMLAGTPSVTTSIGAEAMQLNEHWNGAVENSVEAFASKAVELYQNAEKWHQAQQNGFSIIENRFKKDTIQHELMRKIQSLRENIIQHRLNNFTGKMLQHHSHKSTEYMARWIEAKNKN